MSPMGLGLAKRTSRTAACPAPLRRVEWVRVTVEGRSVRAEAIGVGYRLPTSCRISMAMAADLARQGVPLSVRTVDGDRAVTGDQPDDDQRSDDQPSGDQPSGDQPSGDQRSGDHAAAGRAVEAGREGSR
jgi:hypothetical protein